MNHAPAPNTARPVQLGALQVVHVGAVALPAGTEVTTCYHNDDAVLERMWGGRPWAGGGDWARRVVVVGGGGKVPVESS